MSDARELMEQFAEVMAVGGMDLAFILWSNGEALLSLTDNMPRLDAVGVLRQGALALAQTADQLERDEVKLLGEVQVEVDDD